MKPPEDVLKGSEAPIDEPEYFTPEQLAKKLNMSIKWVQKHTLARRIPGQIKIGRLWRYRRWDVERRLLSSQFLLETVAQRIRPNEYRSTRRT